MNWDARRRSGSVSGALRDEQFQKFTIGNSSRSTMVDWTYRLDLDLALFLLIIIIAMLDYNSVKDLDFNHFPSGLQILKTFKVSSVKMWDLSRNPAFLIITINRALSTSSVLEVSISPPTSLPPKIGTT